MLAGFLQFIADVVLPFCLHLDKGWRRWWRSGHALLQVQCLRGQISSLYQPPRGLWPTQAATWKLLHHPIHLRTSPGRQLHRPYLHRKTGCLHVSVQTNHVYNCTPVDLKKTWQMLGRQAFEVWWQQ